MEEHGRWDELRHDIKSKSASLQSAAGLLREAPAAERRELLALMAAAARDLSRYVTELEGELDPSGRFKVE